MKKALFDGEPKPPHDSQHAGLLFYAMLLPLVSIMFGISATPLFSEWSRRFLYLDFVAVNLNLVAITLLYQKFSDFHVPRSGFQNMLVFYLPWLLTTVAQNRGYGVSEGHSEMYCASRLALLCYRSIFSIPLMHPCQCVLAELICAGITACHFIKNDSEPSRLLVVIQLYLIMLVGLRMVVCGNGSPVRAPQDTKAEDAPFVGTASCEQFMMEKPHDKTDASASMGSVRGSDTGQGTATFAHLAPQVLDRSRSAAPGGVAKTALEQAFQAQCLDCFGQVAGDDAKSIGSAGGSNASESGGSCSDISDSLMCSSMDAMSEISASVMHGRLRFRAIATQTDVVARTPTMMRETGTQTVAASRPPSIPQRHCPPSPPVPSVQRAAGRRAKSGGSASKLLAGPMVKHRRLARPDTARLLLMEAAKKLNVSGTGCCSLHIIFAHLHAQVRHVLKQMPCMCLELNEGWQCAVCLSLHSDDREDSEDEGSSYWCDVCGSTEDPADLMPFPLDAGTSSQTLPATTAGEVQSP